MVIKKTKNVIKSITYREISFKLNVLCQILKEIVCVKHLVHKLIFIQR